MGWTTEESGFDFRQWQEIFLYSIASRLALEPTQLLRHGYADLIPRR
jgi:hypothetical protein